MYLKAENSLLPLNDGSSIAIQEVVRTVPHKRSVCRGEWHGKPVFAKLFFGKKNQHYAARDAHGVAALLDANILTPILLTQTKTQDGNAEVLIFEALVPSENCEVLWQKSTSTERLLLAKKLCATLAKHHAANLLQTDLYLKNFLYFQKDIVTLDGDGIRKFEKLGSKQALRNLAVLLSKLDVLEVESWGGKLLESYLEGKPNEYFTLENVKKLSADYRRQAADKYAKKVFRTCTDVQVKKSARSFLAMARIDADALQNVTANQLDSTIQTAKTLKNGRTCTVALADFYSKQCVIKRYNIKHIGHFLWRMLRKTRAENSWENAHRLTLLGVPTARPMALLEERFGFLKGRAYFLTEFVDTPDIKQFFKQTTDKAARAEVVKNIVQLFYRLFLLNISHGDFKANNIKICHLQPVLIDLDSVRQHQVDFFAHKAHVRDLKRFMQNWKDDVSLYNAFLKTFKVVYAEQDVLRMAQILD